MGKIDKIKESIGWLKVIFAILVATDISLIGWLFSNYDDISAVKSIVSTFVMIVVSIGIIFVNRKAMAKIDELEDL